MTFSTNWRIEAGALSVVMSAPSLIALIPRPSLPFRRLQWLAPAVLSILFVVGCRGSERAAAPSEALLSPQQIESTWPWQAAFAEGLSADLFSRMAGRWLGGDESGWPVPGHSRAVLAADGATAAERLLALRELREDRQAMEHLGSLHAQASCRLAQDPNAFGSSLPEGYQLGAAACASLGDAAGEQVANSHVGSAGADPGSAPGRSSSGAGAAVDVVALLSPQLRVLDVRGERLEYLLLQPTQFAAAIALLQSWAEATPQPNAAAEDLGQFLATSAATTGWTMSPVAGAESTLLSAQAVLTAAKPGPGRLAEVESMIEEAIRLWQRGLSELPRDGALSLDAGGRALLARWFRRALYRDLGVRALAEGDSELALLALEEAAEARGRVRPGSGLDPLLLAALARARYECNELQRAVELLDDMAAVKGWQFAAPVARTIARVAVVGSGADAKVNR